jgi:hypothetical protein
MTAPSQDVAEGQGYRLRFVNFVDLTCNTCWQQPPEFDDPPRRCPDPTHAEQRLRLYQVVAPDGREVVSTCDRELASNVFAHAVTEALA